jgi:hypothetical protein
MKALQASPSLPTVYSPLALSSLYQLAQSACHYQSLSRGCHCQHSREQWLYDSRGIHKVSWRGSITARRSSKGEMHGNSLRGLSVAPVHIQHAVAMQEMCRFCIVVLLVSIRHLVTNVWEKYVASTLR